LTAWEASSERRRKEGKPCIPQPQFPSQSLVAANNYYDYRNRRIYLDLDSSTGQYRRLLFGEDANGHVLYSRMAGCFYQRTGEGADASYGSQLMLDTSIPNSSSSDVFDPFEIFYYDIAADGLNTTRFDDSSDWNYTFCMLSTPWKYCTDLRDGNVLFWPVLTSDQQSELLSEALLIRRQYNYTTIPKEQFEAIWSNPGPDKQESDIVNYRYVVVPYVDTPQYISDAWQDYVKGIRPNMPDVTSNEMPPICYNAKKKVVLADGSTAYIQGEVCYEKGQYQFIGHEQ
jgi:hypothetical protein